MDRKEIDEETRATKNTKNLVYWIVGIGILLAIIAFAGGLFNHGGSVTPGTDTNAGTVLSDTVSCDRMTDTLATDAQR